MKRLFFVVMCSVYMASAVCQNTIGKADDLSRLVLTPYVDGNSNIPSYASNVISNKLNQVVTKYGVGGTSIYPRFVITANLLEIGKDITATAPPMVALTLSPTIYIGDALSGELYASCQLKDVKAVGENETKAYLDAIKRINVDNQEIAQCINIGKTRIIEFYNSQIDFLIAEAESLVDRQQYDDAMILLSSVPDVCKDAYEKAMRKISDVYQAKIDTEGLALYNEAYALWKADKSKDSAFRVVELLAQINPLSSAAKQGRGLVASVESHWAEIVTRRRELEERAWAFKMQQYQDEQDARTAQREMEHEYKMQESNFNYEVAMRRAETGADASNLALQEVKSVVKTMSNGKSRNGMLGNLSNKVSSWFN